MATFALSLASCSGAKQLSANQLNNPETQYTPPSMNGASGGGIGNLLTLGGGNKAAPAGSASGVAVNAYLWRASLDTLSFMPLASADPFAGVIITDWYSPPATPNERFKATAYVLGSLLSANDVKVSVFRQTLEAGTWVDQPVDPATANGIEDRILARAAELKAAGQLNG
ncbi:MAG: DUF3576 domain-containing protein [Acidiphilium sp.]|nr:DUF3576 domain-containing protein [Acidiphilium sp.]MDD4934517.1 DUF3576 domain-containing protein [Acidiphilium sp.]